MYVSLCAGLSRRNVGITRFLHHSKPCIRGHRATTCNHSQSRVLVPVRRPGRPLADLRNQAQAPAPCARQPIAPAVAGRCRCQCRYAGADGDNKITSSSASTASSAWGQPAGASLDHQTTTPRRVRGATVASAQADGESSPSAAISIVGDMSSPELPWSNESWDEILDASSRRSSMSAPASTATFVGASSASQFSAATWDCSSQSHSRANSSNPSQYHAREPEYSRTPSRILRSPNSSSLHDIEYQYRPDPNLCTNCCAPLLTGDPCQSPTHSGPFESTRPRPAAATVPRIVYVVVPHPAPLGDPAPQNWPASGHLQPSVAPQLSAQHEALQMNLCGCGPFCSCKGCATWPFSGALDFSSPGSAVAAEDAERLLTWSLANRPACPARTSLARGDSFATSSVLNLPLGLLEGAGWNDDFMCVNYQSPSVGQAELWAHMPGCQCVGCTIQ